MSNGEWDPENGIPAEEIRAQTDRVLAAFGTAYRQKGFLRYTIDKVLAGESTEIKEFVIANQVYGRDESYDPKVDSIVRVEASRIRNRLQAYYEGPGLADPVVIELPKGSYVPVFRRNESQPAPSQPAPVPPKRRPWLAAAVALGLAGTALTLWTVSRRQTPAGPPTLAILPVVSLSPGHGPLAATLGKELESSLTRSPEFRLIRTTPGQTQRPNFVLDSSLDGDGPATRLTAQLIDARDGGYVWTGRFDLPAGGAPTAAANLTAQLETQTRRYLEQQSAAGTPHAKALALYRAANTRPGYDTDSLTSRGTLNSQLQPLEELNRTISLLEQAVAADPTFALAPAALADYYRAAADYDPRLLAKAKENGRKAIALDPRLAEAHYTLGFIYLLLDWDAVAAATEFRACLESEPRTLSAYRLLADTYSILGRHDDARATVERARAVYPAHPVIETSAAIVLFNARRFPEMEQQARRNLERFPDFHLAHWTMGLALEQLHRLPEAITEEQACLELSPGDTRCSAALGHMYGVTGDHSSARQILSGYRARPPTMSKAAYVQALIHAGLNEPDQAFARLEAAVAAREFDVPYARVEPRLDSLRSQPRFQALLRSAGLTW